MNDPKYIPMFENFLENCGEINEGKKYPYGCAMLQFDFPEIKLFHEKIDSDDLTGSGFETEPHVTLLYGLHDDEIDEGQVIDICQSIKIGHMDLHNVSLFQNDEYDVLKFDVRSTFLHKINEELVKLPHTTDYPDYHAHCTIAYLKPGKGKEYVEKFSNRSFEVYPTRFVYSKPSGEKVQAGVSMKNEMR